MDKSEAARLMQSLRRNRRGGPKRKDKLTDKDAQPERAAPAVRSKVVEKRVDIDSNFDFGS